MTKLSPNYPSALDSSAGDASPRKSIFDMTFKEALIEAAKRHPNSMKIVDESIHEYPGPNSIDGRTDD